MVNQRDLAKTELRGGIKMIKLLLTLFTFLFYIPYQFYKLDHPTQTKVILENSKTICFQSEDNKTWCVDKDFKDLWDKRQ